LFHLVEVFVGLAGDVAHFGSSGLCVAMGSIVSAFTFHVKVF
jgi:hypothetical protein